MITRTRSKKDLYQSLRDAYGNLLAYAEEHIYPDVHNQLVHKIVGDVVFSGKRYSGRLKDNVGNLVGVLNGNIEFVPKNETFRGLKESDNMRYNVIMHAIASMKKKGLCRL